ncbi:hypothetical protein AAC387_Pa06g2071 [Persea americana]
MTVELGQYDIKCQPRTAIKAQVLADFIIEFTSQSSAPTLFNTELGGNKDTEAITETTGAVLEEVPRLGLESLRRRILDVQVGWRWHSPPVSGGPCHQASFNTRLQGI